MKLRKCQYTAIVVLLAESMVVLLLSAFTPTLKFSQAIEFVGGVAVVSAATTLAAIYFVRRELNVFFLFILLLYLFSFGQCILAFLGVEPYRGVFGIGNGFFEADQIVSSAIFTMLAIIITAIGYCLYKSKSIRRTQMVMKPKGTEKLVKVAWVLLIITVFPTFYVLYQDIVKMSHMGYASTLEGVSGIMRLPVILSGFFQSALLILYCFENRRSPRWIMIITLLVYCALQLAGGSRIAVFRFVIILLVISHLYRKEMTPKRWGLVIGGGLVLVFVFSLVSNIRLMVFITSDIGTLIREATNDLLEDNFLFSAIREMGNTQCINTLVYSECPSNVPYNYGLSYLRSLYGILPNFLGIDYKSVDTVFSPLYTITSAGMGSSYIAEGYWNFGYFALVFYMVVGYLWGRLVEKFRIQCNQNAGTASTFFLTVYVMFFLIFTVRSDFMEFGRSLVYYALVPILLSKVKLKTKTLSVGERMQM